MGPAKRFELVSSLYGPGTLTCSVLVVLSVLTSWTLHPHFPLRDVITNDLVAAVTMPLVAVAHFLHQLFTYNPRSRDTSLLGSCDWDDVRFIAALEAPLTVCEDFAVLSLHMAAVAAWKGHYRRTAIVLLVGQACLVPDLVLFAKSQRQDLSANNLMRPFLFQALPALVCVVSWLALVGAVFLVEAAYRFAMTLAVPPIQVEEVGGPTTIRSASAATRKPHRRRAGRLSALLSAAGAPTVGLIIVWVKYIWQAGFWDALRGVRPLTVRFAPKGLAGIGDLDQAVAVFAGLMVLGFSLWDALRHRQTSRKRSEGILSDG